MVLVRFRPDLDDQLVSLSALTLLVWSSGLLRKIMPEMTYNVLSGVLSPYTTTCNTASAIVCCSSLWLCCYSLEWSLLQLFLSVLTVDVTACLMCLSCCTHCQPLADKRNAHSTCICELCLLACSAMQSIVLWYGNYVCLAVNPCFVLKLLKMADFRYLLSLLI